MIGSVRTVKRAAKRVKALRLLALEPMEPRCLLSAYVVSSTGDDGSANTLRWAIAQVNADPAPGQDTIQFAFSTPIMPKIVLENPLPTITHPVAIDGTANFPDGSSAMVELDGSGLPSGSNGLDLEAGSSSVTGLSIVGFSGSAIVLDNSTNNVISGDFLGVQPSGTTAEANGYGISGFGSSGNSIGAIGGAGFNVISGNSFAGIRLMPGVESSSSNIIAGNRIGTSSAGTAPLGNGSFGIFIAAGTGDQVGGAGAGVNVIAANGGSGIELTDGTTVTTVMGNLIGAGLNPGELFGNAGDGIKIDDSPNNVIGGPGPNQGNMIVGNEQNGIETTTGSSGELIVGNAIGTDFTGEVAAGNSQNGIQLASSGNTIGGVSATAANLINNNGAGAVGAGVELKGNVTQNAILSNQIYQNAGLGINLGDGPTPEHQPGTPGPNYYQNYPVLSVLNPPPGSTGVSIKGSLLGLPSTPYLVQFFSNTLAPGQGYGQGQVLFDTMTATTDSNGSATFQVAVPGNVAPGSTISATATDPQGDTSEFSADVQTPGGIDLILSGTATPQPALAGENVTFHLSVANLGSESAHLVQLADVLPAGTTLVSVIGGGFGEPGVGGGSIRLMLGTIAAGSSASVTLVVSTAPTAIGTLTDTASVTSSETDLTPSQESLTLTSTLVGASDLGVQFTESPASIFDGAPVTLTLGVMNNGPSAAPGTVVTLPISTLATFVSASSTVGTTQFAAGVLTADLGTLAAGDSESLTVVLDGEDVGSLVETASVQSQNVDTNPANNSAQATVTVVPAADLEIEVTGSASKITSGVPFTYSLTVTNHGPQVASGVTIADTLPTGLTAQSATLGGATVPLDGNLVTTTVATLASGASAVLEIVVEPTALPGAVISDTATVASAAPADPDQANNQATLVLDVRGTSNLSVSAVSGVPTDYVGQPIEYTVSVTNDGPNDEPDAVITVPCPPGILSASNVETPGAAGWSVSQGVVTIDVGPIAVQQTQSVELSLTPLAGAAGTLAATFTVGGQNLDPVNSNNESMASVTVIPASDVSVAISPSAPQPIVGVPWSYTITATNLGLSDATDVTLFGLLPANVMFVSATDSAGVAVVPTGQGTFSVDLGAVEAGGSASLTIDVDPLIEAIGLLPISASATADQHDPDPFNNSASAAVTVAPSVNLGIELTSSSSVVETGQSLSWYALIQNDGLLPAANVTVVLPITSAEQVSSWNAPMGTISMVGGQMVDDLGTMAPGAEASLSLVVIPTVSGPITQVAQVAASEYNTNPSGGSASTTASVVESPGQLAFSTAGVTVPETAGSATFTVIRSLGWLGQVSVNYQTVSMNATPGLDYQPVSGTLWFAAGQATATISVPVLVNPYDNQDEYVSLQLSSPGGGGTLGSQTSSVLHIVDVNPDVIAPMVSSLTWTGNANVISTITLGFSAPLDPTFAEAMGNYLLFNPSKGNQADPIVAVAYNPANFSVTLTPASPLPSGQYFELESLGTGAAAIRDLAGNLLDGAGNGVAGSNYAVLIGQGKKLSYVDHRGNRVSLKLAAGGYLEQIRSLSGDGLALNLVGIVPTRSKLSGSVKSSVRGGGSTSLGIIRGLGQFGEVKVSLAAPKFTVLQYPFQRNGKGTL